MNQVLIKSLNKTILLSTDSDSVVNYLKSNIIPHIFIQGYSVEEEVVVRKADIELIHYTSDRSEIYVNFNKNKYVVYDNWEDNIPTYVLSFLQLCFNSLLLNDSIYTLHGSSVQGKKNDFVFTGKAGAGKTSVMLELVKNKGYKFISNNKVSLQICEDNAYIVSGTKGITIRDTDNFENYKNLVLNNFQKVYANRTAFIFNNSNSANLGLKNPITIFSLKINTGVKEFKQLTYEEAMIYLYPIFIESVDREVVLFNFKQTVPLPYEEYLVKEKALEDLKLALKKIKVYHLSGSMEFILDNVKELDN